MQMASAIGSGVGDVLNLFPKFYVNQGLNIYDAFGGEGAKEAKDGIISAIESTQSRVVRHACLQPNRTDREIMQ